MEEQNQNQTQYGIGDEDPFVELIPIKKYFLIQKLQTLKSILSERGHPSTYILEVILLFAQNLSYPVLLTIVYNFLNSLNEVNSNAQQQSETKSR